MIDTIVDEHAPLSFVEPLELFKSSKFPYQIALIEADKYHHREILP